MNLFWIFFGKFNRWIFFFFFLMDKFFGFVYEFELFILLRLYRINVLDCCIVEYDYMLVCSFL